MSHDIFMLAYGEPNAAENWTRLKAMVPKHFPPPHLIEGIAGLYAAYSACAQMATTPWFFVVDGDNWILDGFDFSLPFAPAENEVGVWAATNQFNPLYYGHGGIKLFPKGLLDGTKPIGLDVPFSPGDRTRFVDVKASEHRFNTSPYATWAAVFRECVKLGVASRAAGLKGRAIARHRLEHWAKVKPDAPFAAWCAQGAADGLAYAREFHGDEAKLARINDYAWLRAAFARRRELLAPAYDVIMLASGEKNAAENWAHLAQIVPEAKLIENTSSMAAGYAACAAAATTSHFFSVDADNWILPSFRFQAPFELAADETVFWYARNPVNGLEYGNGAVKLFPTAAMKDAATLAKTLDFSTEVGRVHYTKTCASEHRFNADPFSAWSGAFRECAKLVIGTTLGDDQARALAKFRLDAWCTRCRTDAAFGDWCLKGAVDGRDFGFAQAGNTVSLAKINDFAWLRATFRARHVTKVAMPLPSEKG